MHEFIGLHGKWRKDGLHWIFSDHRSSVAINFKEVSKRSHKDGVQDEIG